MFEAYLERARGPGTLRRMPPGASTATGAVVIAGGLALQSYADEAMSEFVLGFVGAWLVGVGLAVAALDVVRWLLRPPRAAATAAAGLPAARLISSGSGRACTGRRGRRRGTRPGSA